MQTNQKSNKWAIIIILLISFVVLGVVAALHFFSSETETSTKIHFFPKFHAIINSLVSVLLLAGLYFIKTKRIKLHKGSMVLALIGSGIFLVSYVYYHSLAQPTTFGGEGVIRIIYYFILITHIVLAAASLPFILYTAFLGLSSNYQKHKKIARFTWPVWFYVAVTGVLVYILISPYY